MPIAESLTWEPKVYSQFMMTQDDEAEYAVVMDSFCQLHFQQISLMLNRGICLKREHIS